MCAFQIRSIRPIVPARNFLLSKLFYRELGFTTTVISPDLAEIGPSFSAFFLKDAWTAQWAANTTLHVSVDNLIEFWDRVMALDLGIKYAVDHPGWLVDEVWGEMVGYLVDPSGVRLQFVNQDYAKQRSLMSKFA